MSKISKSERLAWMSQYFVNNPSKMITLQYLSGRFDIAKSTLFEDVDKLKHLFIEQGIGEIKSITGAAGGVYFAPIYTDEQLAQVSDEICQLLSQESRIITGGYLYTNDILYSPECLEKISKAIVTQFNHLSIDAVVTVETKGIPLAMMIARLMNKPVAAIRKSARLTEGATLQMNYMASSTSTIKTMALPIKTLERDSKVLFVDDFMKAGGTAKGVIDLLKELDIEVVGKAFFMATKEPKQKLIEDYYAMVLLNSIDEHNRIIDVEPNL